MVVSSLKKINRVIISIGHDKKAQGAENAKGEKENAICEKIAVRIAQYLRANDVVVLLLPDYTLADTIRTINKLGNSVTDIAFEIHKDSFEHYNEQHMNRRCGLYYASSNKSAATIAANIVNTMKTEGAHKTSWVRPDTMSNHKRLAFCKSTKMFAMIAELGFIEGKNDDNECEWYAWTFSKAILSVLDIPIRRVPLNSSTINPVF